MDAKHPKNLILFIPMPHVSEKFRDKCGFALIVTLALMSFILLLNLSLSTLVNVELATSSQHKLEVEAKNNAVYALEVALGELQAAAGPDQRTSATGDFFPDTDPTKTNYTAVWDTDPNAANPDTPIAWLASGADDPSFSRATATPASWPILVSSRADGTIEPVRAKPNDILNNQGDVFGQYAWWVGDEGVKAKFNAVESEWLREDGTERQRLTVSARSGIEAIEDFGTDKFAYGDDDFYQALTRTVNQGSAEIIDQTLPDSLSDHFHDLTFHSLGILTNTHAGGLKEDLAHYFESQTTGLTGPVIPNAQPPLDRITWEQMRSFYRLGNAISGDQIAIQPQAEDQHGIYPIVGILHLNFGFTLESDYNQNPNQSPGDRTYQVAAHIRPWFVLINPYNIRLTGDNFRLRVIPSTANRFLVSYGDINSPTVIIDEPLARILSNLVLTVPNVTIDPGEARIYTLSYDQQPDYDYDFTIDARGFYSNYDGWINNTPEQFVCVSADPAWDDGLASIRMSRPQWTVNGNDLEDTGTGAIKRMYWETSGEGGAYWIRTDIGASNLLEDSEDMLQMIGQFGAPAMARNADFAAVHGFWEIDNLPVSVTTFTTNEVVTNNNLSGRTPNNLRSTSGSMIFVLSQATTTNAEDLYTGYDGWATDYNVRGPVVARYKGPQTFPPGYHHYSTGIGSWFYDWMTEDNLGFDPAFPWGAGYSFRTNGPAAKVYRGIFFDITRNAAAGNAPPLASLGRLQHFNAGGWPNQTPFNGIPTADASVTLGYAPSYAIANSYANPYVARDQTTSTDGNNDFFDTSYLLNEALFNRYFFSSILPDSDEVIRFDQLPNRRLTPILLSTPDAVYRESPESVAANCFVDGAFNVNSTSVDAWHALLSSFRGFSLGSQTDGEGIFPRSLYQEDAFAEGNVNGIAQAAASWSGWRHITDIESPNDDEDRKLRKVAEAIVEEVRLRGPFRSLADFVNRDLVAPDAADARLGLSGALQAALDRTANVSHDAAYHVDLSSIKNGNLSEEGIVDGEHVGSGPVYDVDGQTLLANASSASSIPGWVLQGDLLQTLAPALSARSDTFIIRTYGSSINPLSTEINAEVYLEAVVQRVPDYIDDSQPADTDVAILSPDNQRFGRAFRIVSLQFLDEDSI